GWLALGGVALLQTSCNAMATTHFDQFLPDWNPMLQGMLSNNCSSELATYKTGERPPNTKFSVLITPVIDCILENLPEHRKMEIGASAVVLGLLPTILSALGSTPAETALVHLRRPLLAMLLAIGSPSVIIMKTSDYKRFTDDLVKEFAKELHPDPRDSATAAAVAPLIAWKHMASRPRRIALSIVQYLVVLAAVGNVMSLWYQLGFHAIVSWAPETIFMVPLWSSICVVLHFGAVWIQSLRLRMWSVGDGHETSKGTSASQQLRRFFGRCAEEYTPSAFQEQRKIRWRGDSAFVNFLIWLLCIGAVINLIFGSMIFSSLLFFSVQDVLLIATRYLVSTIVCRGVSRMELIGAKECTTFHE
ncbi:uncharacterized protein B0I36DRAFT_225495, partial [Microdochium trichocladiopsis]